MPYRMDTIRCKNVTNLSICLVELIRMEVSLKTLRLYHFILIFSGFKLIQLMIMNNEESKYNNYSELVTCRIQEWFYHFQYRNWNEQYRGFLYFWKAMLKFHFRCDLWSVHGYTNTVDNSRLTSNICQAHNSTSCMIAMWDEISDENRHSDNDE